MTEEAIFAMYFSGIVAFQYHPRNPPQARMTMAECLDVAAQMMDAHNRIFHPEKVEVHNG